MTEKISQQKSDLPCDPPKRHASAWSWVKQEVNWESENASACMCAGTVADIIAQTWETNKSDSDLRYT